MSSGAPDLSPPPVTSSRLSSGGVRAPARTKRVLSSRGCARVHSRFGGRDRTRAKVTARPSARRSKTTQPPHCAPDSVRLRRAGTCSPDRWLPGRCCARATWSGRWLNPAPNRSRAFFAPSRRQSRATGRGKAEQRTVRSLSPALESCAAKWPRSTIRDLSSVHLSIGREVLTDPQCRAPDAHARDRKQSRCLLD